MFLGLKKIIFRKYYKELQDIENYMQQYFVHTLPNVKNKPSIAFCISGHIRDYTKIIKNYKIFKEYISNYGSVDVFLSTWNKQNSAHCWSKAHGLSADDSHTIDINEKEIIDNFETTNIEINDYDFFNSAYSPLRYSIFTKNEYNWDPRGIYGGVVNSTKMFYLMHKANLLKLKQEQLNNCTYDWVFRLRPDMFFNIDICQNTIKLNQLDNTKLYMPGSKNKGDDQFAFGGSIIMDRYASIIYRLSQAFDQNLFGDPESVMKKILFDFIESDIVYIPRCGSLAAERPHSLLPFR